MSIDSIVIVGGGGFAGEVIDTLEATGRTVAGICDDNAAGLSARARQYRFLGSIEQVASEGAERQFVIAIGDNLVREQIAARLCSGGARPVNVVHQTAVVSRSAVLAEQAGIYVGAGAFIGPDCRVGAFALINTGTTVGHGAVLEAFTQLCPGVRVSGGCIVYKGAFLGSNAVLAPGLVVGAWARVAACTFVARAVAPGALVSASPAKQYS